MSGNDDLYAHVKATIQKIRDRGDKPTPTRVVVEAKRNRQKVLQLVDQIMKQEEQEQRDREASTLNHTIGVAILKDREERVAQHTASLNETIDRLAESCSLLDEEISELQAEKDGLEQQLSIERQSHSEKVLSIERDKAELGGKLLSKQGEVDTLKAQLGTAEKKRDEATKKHSGLRETLAKRAEELKSAHTCANTLQQQNAHLEGEHNQAVADLNASTKKMERLEEQVKDLTEQVKTLQAQVEAETTLRFEAEKGRAVAIALLDKAESDKQPTPKSAARTTTKKTSTKTKAAKEAASNE